jgi:hypothetical protein
MLALTAYTPPYQVPYHPMVIPNHPVTCSTIGGITNCY